MYAAAAVRNRTMSIKMIGLDLDGTVLNSRKQMTEAVGNAISAAVDAGIVVVPVTGRPLTGIPEFIFRNTHIRYAITSNGAIITDTVNNSVCESHFLSRDITQEAVKHAATFGQLYSIFVNGTGYSSVEAFNRIRSVFSGTDLEDYVEYSRKPVEDLTAFLNQPSKIFSSPDSLCLNYDCVENIWFHFADSGKCDVAEAMFKSIAPDAMIHRMVEDEFEMEAPDADKGSSFLSLAQMLGIRQEETMAIGDSVNDIGFMKKAGISVAMGNSRPMIKELADFTTDDNNHDGVAKAILRFI